MNDEDFDGTVVLEQLAALGVAERFLEAADADDFGTVTTILEDAGVDEGTIQVVIRKMRDFDGHF